MKKLILSGLMLLASSGLVNADIITQWNFNSTTADGNTATGSTNPSIGVGTAALVGGTTGTFASGDASGGSTDPATGDDSGWNISTFAAQGTGNLQRGVQFNVSTTGMQDIVVTWDHRHSNTAARHVQFQYTLDGSNFVSTGLSNGGLFTATGGDTWFNNRSVDLTSVVGANDNALFGFRIVAAFDPAGAGYLASNPAGTYATTSTWRFDMVSVSGITAVPEPASMVLLGVAGIGGLAFRQFRRKTNSSESVAC
jgi:hypothetical protein